MTRPQDKSVEIDTKGLIDIVCTEPNKCCGTPSCLPWAVKRYTPVCLLVSMLMHAETFQQSLTVICDALFAINTAVIVPSFSFFFSPCRQISVHTYTIWSYSLNSL